MYCDELEIKSTYKMLFVPHYLWAPMVARPEKDPCTPTMFASNNGWRHVSRECSYNHEISRERGGLDLRYTKSRQDPEE